MVTVNQFWVNWRTMSRKLAGDAVAGAALELLIGSWRWDLQMHRIWFLGDHRGVPAHSPCMRSPVQTRRSGGSLNSHAVGVRWTCPGFGP